MLEPRGVAVALILLAGCSSDEHSAAPVETGEATPDAAIAKRPPAGPTAATQPGDLPPADAERRYVGKWATRLDRCDGGAWVFTRDHFGLEDGPMCDFRDVAEIPGGYSIDAHCKRRDAESDSIFTLHFAESVQAMMVEGLDTLPETGLVYCGPV